MTYLKPNQHGRRLVVGHRGYSLVYPENTILAFKEAFKAGAKAIEIDVRMTLDKELIIMHDTTVDRTTNGTGSVANLTLDYIQGLDAGAWKGSEFANREDTKVPTLNQVVAEFENEPVFLVLHISDNKIETGLKALSIIEQRKLLNKCIFFQTETVINVIKQINPRAMTMTGGMPREDAYIHYLNQAISYNHSIVSVNAHGATESMVQDIISKGFPVLASYISHDFENVSQRLIDYGVEMLLTDDVISTMDVFNANGLTQIDPYINLNNLIIKNGKFIQKINGEILELGVVVSKDCKLNGLYAGVPAKRIKDLD